MHLLQSTVAAAAAWSVQNRGSIWRVAAYPVCTALPQVSEDDLRKRQSAVAVYMEEPHNAAARIKAYMRLHPETKRRGLSDYISYWSGHFKQYGHVLDIKPAGRQPLVSDQEALEAAYLFGVDRYSDLEEAAQEVPLIKLLLARTGVTPRMLLRRMELLEPELSKCHTPEIKKDLSPQEKADRLATAKQWLEHDHRWLNRIVWLDCKSIWVRRLGGKPKKVWGIMRHPIYANLLKKKQLYTASGVHLKWYSGVNGKAGWVFFKYVTGTTTIKHDREPYKVGFHAYLGQIHTCL